MLHEEGLIKVAMLINGSETAEPLVLHLEQTNFEGYSPIELDPLEWFVGDDGYMQQKPVVYALHAKADVRITGFYIAFKDGTKLFSEVLEKPIDLYYIGDEARINPRYKVKE